MLELNIVPTPTIATLLVTVPLELLQLADDIIMLPLLPIFKRQLKTSLFSRSFDVGLTRMTLSTLFPFVVKCS